MPKNPIQLDLATECRKAAKMLYSFVKPDPTKKNNIDSIIPPDILHRAKGLAILQVVKAGFVWSGRIGSGIVVARLEDGSWSPPSAIGTAGVGFGGQIGAEITDFVIVLNTLDAVNAFSMGGNVTFGGNLSVAAGPVGRTAEAAGTLGKMAAIFSYSKSKGLFAGVSLEGSAIVERKDANAKFYGQPGITAKQILSGMYVERPSAALELYRALDNRTGAHSSIYSSNIVSPTPDSNPPGYSPTSPPAIPQRNQPQRKTAVALYDFEAERSDDLPFKRGDVINIVQQSDDQNDWWVGSIGTRQGNFPANYVRIQ